MSMMALVERLAMGSAAGRVRLALRQLVGVRSLSHGS